MRYHSDFVRDAVYTLVDSGEMGEKDTIGSAHRGMHYFS